MDGAEQANTRGTLRVARQVVLVQGDNTVTEREHEVHKNYTAFKEQLPTLLSQRAGKFALMRDREIIEFFDTAGDAMKFGKLKFTDGLFSIQEVTGRFIDLGYFSHADPVSPV